MSYNKIHNQLAFLLNSGGTKEMFVWFFPFFFLLICVTVQQIYLSASFPCCSHLFKLRSLPAWLWLVVHLSGCVRYLTDSLFSPPPPRPPFYVSTVRARVCVCVKHGIFSYPLFLFSFSFFFFPSKYA